MLEFLAGPGSSLCMALITSHISHAIFALTLQTKFCEMSMFLAARSLCMNPMVDR